MADKPIEQYDEIELSRNVSSESGMQKLFRAGVLALGFSVIGKKMGAKRNDLLKYTGVAAASMLLSDDDNRAGDLMAVGAVFGAASGVKYLREKALSDINTYTKIYKSLERADDVINNINIMNLSVGDVIGKKFQQNYQKIIDGVNEEEIGKLKTASNYIKAGYQTINQGVSFLFKEGISKSIDNLSQSDLRKQYEAYYKNIDLKKIETTVNNYLEETGIGVTYSDPNLFERALNSTLSPFLKASGVVNGDQTKRVSIKEFQKMKKISMIENNTFFTDMLGMYSKLDKNSGKVVARYGELLKDNANTLNSLERLADNFRKSLGNKEAELYYRSTDEEKEKLFLNYLKEGGFQEVIDKFYNKDNHIKIGEVNDLFKNINMNEIRNPELKDFLSSSTERQIKHFETFKYMSDSNGEMERIVGIKNADILKNFSFTTVLTKTKYGVQDATALNGSVMLLQGLEGLNRNIVSSFSTIFSKFDRTWQPFSLIDSRNRIKNIVSNDILGFDYNNYGFILNGKRITEEVKEIKDGNKTRFIVDYATNGKDNYRINYQKTVLDVVNEDYKVSKKNLRNKSTAEDIIKTYKDKGAKQAMSELSYSVYNPFSIRYDAGTGIRGVKAEDGYFKENKNVFSILDKKNPNDLGIIERREGIAKRVFSMFFGDHNDINVDRMRSESDKYESILAKCRNVLLNRFFQQGVMESDTEVFSDASKYIEKYYKPQLIKSLKTRNKEVNTVLKEAYFATSKEALNDKIKLLRNCSINEFIEVRNVLAGLIEANKTLAYMNRKDLVKKRADKIFTSDAFKSYLQSDMIGGYDKNFFSNMFKKIKSGKERKDLEELYGVVSSFVKAKQEVTKDIETFLDGSTSVFKDSFMELADGLDIKTNKNPFNPVYEMMRGKRLNDHFDKYIKPKLDDENSLVGNIIKTLRRDLEPTYSVTDVGKTVETMFNKYIGADIKDVFSKFGNSAKKGEESAIKLKTFDFFKKIKSDITEGMKQADAKTLSELEDKFGKFNIDKVSFENLIKIRDELLYKKTGEVVSSVIVEDSLKKGNSIREILQNVKESIIELIHAKPFDETKAKHFRSKNFNKTDSTFNLGAKIILNNMQNATEYIGIERLTNKQLGDYFSQQMWNYTKYRLLPIAGAVAGAMAVDSASDAIIPDEVPIIGNGISGVVAKGYATARIGAQYALKYTGGLSLMRMAENAMPGIISGAPVLRMLDPLMDPEEMIDVYFKGKAIRVNENRYWFSTGRQAGKGEEFGQYRPHLLYQLQNKTSGVYDNKIEKFFRKDFLPTKYLWYMADPYKEERNAYEKFGAAYPKTEQLFLDIPVIGHFLNATIGEVIKPTRYMGEKQWKVNDHTMINPNYDPNNPSSPKYLHYEEPNKFVASFFEAIEDLETWSGLPGYLAKNATKGVFGASNPYENKVTLKSIDKDIGYFKQYDNLQLGGMNGVTEPIRRFIDDPNGLDTIDINPLRQNLPEWMPEFYKRGNNPYLSMAGGQFLMPGEAFDKMNSNFQNEDLLKIRTLSMLAPYSSEFDKAKARLMNEELTADEREHFYTSLGYASDYGKYEEIKNRSFGIKKLDTINLTIDKKISPNEFISNGVRYKLDTVTDNFNKLSERYGASTATQMMKDLDEQFQEGGSYSFEISKNATISGGIDRDGDYFKITSKDIDKRLDLDRSAYNNATFSEMLGKLNFVHKLRMESGMPLDFEKKYGVKTAANEWSTEHVEAPVFRDWDDPISSFVLPFYTFSANSFSSSYSFKEKAEEMYYGSNATTNVLGTLAAVGGARNFVKKLTMGDAIVSDKYKEETEVYDELEKIKFISGDKSYYNMTGKENLKQFEGMLNEEDSKFLEDLANTQNESERNKILSHANERMANVLKTIWNRQQEQLTGKGKYEVEMSTFDSAIDIGYYDGNSQRAKILLEKSLGISRSKLDEKRYGVISSYRGSVSSNEAKYISDRMYQRYGAKPTVDSTIYPDGTININKRRE